MESHIRRPSSTLNVCDAIYDGLLVIKRNSEELLRAAETSVTHQDALRFVKTATSLLIKIFPDMKRSLDLNVITIQIHHIACDLELHLTLPEEINSVSSLLIFHETQLLHGMTNLLGKMLPEVYGMVFILSNVQLWPLTMLKVPPD